MRKRALRGERTILGSLWIVDKFDLEWRLKCIRGFIKGKKKTMTTFQSHINKIKVVI